MTWAHAQRAGDDLRTVPAVLERMARQLPDHDALVAPDRRLTFAQLRGEVRRAAAAMIALGVARGDRNLRFARSVREIRRTPRFSFGPLRRTRLWKGVTV